jgi:hypothetical protein
VLADTARPTQSNVPTLKRSVTHAPVAEPTVASLIRSEHPTSRSSQLVPAAIQQGFAFDLQSGNLFFDLATAELR